MLEQLISSFGSFVVILIIAGFAILLTLSLFTPLFIFLINRNLGKLLREQQVANEGLAKNMDKMGERLKNISKTICKKKFNSSLFEENQEQRNE